MGSVAIMVVSFAGYIIAYKTYGKYLAGRIFEIDPQARTPAHELRDEVDYMPAKKEVLFGHHFTSIAGVGPIVGPAIGIMYGWVPALLWIFLGSIFMGAVHDFSALVISARNKGQSIGELTSTLVNPRVRTLFLLIVFLALTIAVIAAAALAIAPYRGVYGMGGMILWPLFGATNQLIAALALLVATVYLAKKGKPVVFTFIPMCIMLAITGTAMTLKIRDFAAGGAAELHLLIVGIIIVTLQVWMIVEVIINYRGHMLTRSQNS